MMIPKMIKPQKPEDVERWDGQSLGYRILQNEHLDDVRTEVSTILAPEVAQQAKVNPDMSRNPLRHITAELNIIYNEPPTATIEDGSVDLSRVLSPSLWPLSQQRQGVVLAIGECLTRLDWDASRQRVQYRVVPPHTVVVVASPDDPSQIVFVRELRERIYNGKSVWAWDEWDNTDPNTPFFSITVYSEDFSKLVNITEMVMGTSEYPYIDEDGKGILPYVLHHRNVQAGLWNWKASTSLVHSSLRTAALWTHWCDGFVSATNPQRIAIDLDIPGGETSTVGGTPIKKVPLDRTSVLMFRSLNSDRPGSISEWSPALEPIQGSEALNIYTAGIALQAGISADDLQVTTGQSGYAIVLSRAGKRHARRNQVPAARFGDQELLATASRMVGGIIDGYGAPADPEEWSVSYRDIDADAVEAKTRVELAKLQMDAGLISEPEALMMIHPEWDEDKALLEFLKSLEIRARVARAKATLDIANTNNIPERGNEDPEKGQGS